MSGFGGSDLGGFVTRLTRRVVDGRVIVGGGRYDVSVQVTSGLPIRLEELHAIEDLARTHGLTVGVTNRGLSVFESLGGVS